MTPALTFTNPGEIDPRLIRTFGANVKASDSAIGFFGTGLKYAIAGLLRLGQEITIAAGEETYTFGLRKDTIRGKEFEFITMNEEDLGFTTELGKNWLPWQFYRELYCNALDEGGDVHGGGITTLVPGVTQVEIRGQVLVDVHKDRAQWFIPGDELPRIGNEKVAIFETQDQKVFFKGINVGTHLYPALFKYNFLSGLTLTEDRSHGQYWETETIAKNFWQQCTDSVLLRKMLLAPKGTFEYERLAWAGTASPEFLAVMDELIETELSGLSNRVVEYARKQGRLQERFVEVPMTSVEKKMFVRAKEFLERFQLPFPKEILVVETLGNGILGMTDIVERKVYISKLAFAKGTKYLAGTLMEEALHTRGIKDFTYAYQNWLVDRVMSMGEELQGEPL